MRFPTRPRHSRRLAATCPRRRKSVPLWLEVLEDRTVPSGLTVLSGDVSGDGLQDLVFPALDASNHLTIKTLVANGNGTWQTFTTAAGVLPGALDRPPLLADLNGDGMADLVLTIPDPNQGVIVFTALSQGGTFGPLQGTVLGDPTAVLNHPALIGDVNGDTFPDLIFTFADGSGVHARVSLGQGDGTFAHTQQTDLGNTPVLVALPVLAADVNGDRLPDLVFTVADPNKGATVFVALSQGDGTFAPIQRTVLGGPTGLLNQPVLTGDLNGDGLADLIFAFADPIHGVTAYTSRSLGGLGGGYGPLQPTVLGDPASALNHPALVADVTGDGKTDLVLNIADPGQGLVVRSAASLGDGTFGPETTSVLGDGSVVFSDPVQAGPMNRDALDDLLFTYPDANQNPVVAAKIALRTGGFYSVGPGAAPPPTLTGLGNSSAPEGLAQGITVTVNGTNFTGNTDVLWNGSTLATTFVSPTQLQAIVPTLLLGDEGMAAIDALDPTGGSAPTSVPFTITDAGLTDTTMPTTINVAKGSDSGPVTVSTFTDANPGAPLTDFGSPSIDWGDSSTSAGMVQLITRTATAASFRVVGHHTYAQAGMTFTAHVSVADVGGQGFTTAKVQFAVSNALLTDTTPPATLSAAEGNNAAGLVVATFSDSDANGQVADFQNPTITWGDQTTSAGTISVVNRAANGVNFQVVGSHSYPEMGRFPIQVAILAVDGRKLTSSGKITVNVSDALLADTTALTTLTATEGTAIGAPVLATFTDANPPAPASDFGSPTITWGDGQTAAGSVHFVSRTSTAATFQVTGSHTYVSAGTFGIAVALNDVDGQTLSSTGRVSVHVGDALLTDATPVATLGAVEAGSTGTVAVAAFTDADALAPAADLGSPTITWGDGQTSAGTVQVVSRDGAGTHFQVTGSHAYADEGTFNLRVAIKDTGGQTLLSTGKVTAAVTDAVLADLGAIVAPPAVEGADSGSLIAATFTDANPAALVSDFGSPTITWGDGQTSAGTVQLVSRTSTLATFQVSGHHLYADEGVFALKVGLVDVGGQALSSTGKVSVHVADAALTDTTATVTLNGFINKKTGVVTLATFTDANASALVGDFGSPTITWGDGQTSAGTLQLVSRTGTLATFRVQGSHAYASTGSFSVQVAIQDVGGQGVTVDKVSLQINLATWTVTDVAVGSDGKARLLWDQAGGATTEWSVDNSLHVASGPVYGPLSGWIARATAAGGDGFTRILWTNTSGAVALWLEDPAGTLLKSAVFGPLTGWTAVDTTVGVDNQTRILWTNVNGAAALWSVDNTLAITGTSVYGPFSGWTARRLAAGSDGLSRLLWTSTSGAAALWVLGADGMLRQSQVYGPLAGWTATDVAVGSDNQARLLWTNTSGAAALWVINSSLAVSSSMTYAPLAGWTALRLASGSDGLVRLLWANTDGTAALWLLNGDGSSVTAGVFGPF